MSDAAFLIPPRVNDQGEHISSIKEPAIFSFVIFFTFVSLNKTKHLTSRHD